MSDLVGTQIIGFLTHRLINERVKGKAILGTCTLNALSKNRYMFEKNHKIV